MLSKILPFPVRATIGLRWFGFRKIPLLFFTRPSVVEMNNETVIIKLPFKKKNRNHLNSMYFGALAVGADCGAGLAAMRAIDLSGEKVALIFKDLKADFLKRAEGDVFFTCTQGKEVTELVDKAVETGDRVEMPVKVTATVPDQFGEDPVAEFVLTLSLKKKD